MDKNNNFSLLDELKECIIEDEARSLGIELTDDTQILSVDQANFFLRRLEELNSQEEDVNAMCDKEIENFVNRVNKFREGKLQTINNTQNYFKRLLEKYAESELADSQKKSVKLPFGTLQFKKTPTQYNYEDEKLLDYLTANGKVDLINVKKVPNKAELKKKVTVQEDGTVLLDGVVVEGVTATEGTTNFSVKLNS